MIRFASICTLALTACDREKTIEEDTVIEENDLSIIEGVFQEGNQLILELHPEQDIYFLTCSGSSIELLSQVVADDPMSDIDLYTLADPYIGYYLDGEFQYPANNLMCDVQECLSVDWAPEIGLVYYTQTDTMAPPEDIEEYILANNMADFGVTLEEYPATVPVLSTQPLTGKIDVSVYYFTTEECTAEKQMDSISFQIE